MTILSVKHNPMLREVSSRTDAEVANSQKLHDFIVNRLPKDGTQLAELRDNNGVYRATV